MASIGRTFGRTLPLLVALGTPSSLDDDECSQPTPVDTSAAVEVLSSSQDFGPRLRAVANGRVVTEDSLPRVHISDEEWASAVGVRDAVARCVQGRGVVCNAEDAHLTCFNIQKGDFLPAEMRVRESHEPDWHYEVEVSPLGREAAAMVFSVGMDDPDRVDTLRLVCDEARRIARPYVADWKPFCDSEIEDCDVWAMSAFEETHSLNERRLVSQQLEMALDHEGWPHSRLNLFDLSIHLGGSSNRMAVGVDWDIWEDEPQFFTRISDGWFRSDFERCTVSACDARTYARNLNLDSPVYPELGPFWPPTSYGVSYP